MDGGVRFRLSRGHIVQHIVYCIVNYLFFIVFNYSILYASRFHSCRSKGQETMSSASDEEIYSDDEVYSDGEAEDCDQGISDNEANGSDEGLSDESEIEDDDESGLDVDDKDLVIGSR